MNAPIDVHGPADDMNGSVADVNGPLEGPRHLPFLLFVSHSSTTPAQRQWLDDLVQAVSRVAGEGGHDVEVLYDRRQIMAADVWRRRIAFMLHAAHGGAVLLTEEALSSPWVCAETVFLALRHALDDGFAFAPVPLLDGASLRERLDKACAERDVLAVKLRSVLDLSNVQHVAGRSAHEVAEHIVSALAARGDLGPGSSPAGLLADQLEGLFEGAGTESLRLVARDSSRSVSYLRHDERARAALALAEGVLATGSLVRAREMMRPLGDVFPGERRRRVIEGLAPLPLPADAAALLVRRRRGSTAFVHSELLCDHPHDLVPLLLRRAYLGWERPRYFAVDVRTGSFEDLRRAMQDQIIATMSRARPLTPAEADARLNAVPRFVSVPGPVSDDVLAQLEASYPTTAFIVHRRHADDEPPEAGSDRLMPVTSWLTAAEEDGYLCDYDDALEQL